MTVSPSEGQIPPPCCSYTDYYGYLCSYSGSLPDPPVEYARADRGRCRIPERSHRQLVLTVGVVRREPAAPLAVQCESTVERLNSVGWRWVSDRLDTLLLRKHSPECPLLAVSGCSSVCYPDTAPNRVT